MISLPPELLSIVGLGVIGFIGDRVLVQMGKQTLAIAWDVILSVAATVIGLDYAHEGLKKVGAVFGVHVR